MIDDQDPNAGDELITLRLPRRDADRLREMIIRDQSLSVASRYVRNVLIVTVGIIGGLIAFGGQIKQLLGMH